MFVIKLILYIYIYIYIYISYVCGDVYSAYTCIEIIQFCNGTSVNQSWDLFHRWLLSG